MKRSLILITGSIVTLTGCKTEQLFYQPLTTPAEWCQLRPCVEMPGFIFNEPLGSVLVFLLAALWMWAGFYFLKTHGEQKSRTWFGWSLVLGGLGAALAGISYQSFSYELKCAGREHCLLTNAFEVSYSVVQAVSVSAMLTAVAYACTRNLLRNIIITYCILNAIVYLAITFVGIAQPSKFLLSFEVLMLFALPGILGVLVISAVQFAKNRQPLDRSLLLAAILILLVQAAYFGYYAAGITALLYQGGQGFYFSENDVLHVGMILWLWYVARAVGRHLVDNKATTA